MNPLQILSGGNNHRGMAALLTCRLAKLGCQAKLRIQEAGHTDVVVEEDFYNEDGKLIMKKDEFIRYVAVH